MLGETLADVRLVADYNDELKILADHIRVRSHQAGSLQILEAGCGREWYLDLEGVPYELTGLDIDAAALEARRTIKRDMDHCIHGDLRTANLPREGFDVIYNAFVLEHVEGAATALRNFIDWLKPGGLLIVRVPDRDSVQGFLARVTPHWFHILYYRWAWKLKEAGQPGFAPYPVVYDPIVSRHGLLQFCREHGLEPLELLGVGTYRRGYGLVRRISPIIATVISTATLGRVHSRFCELTLVARKRTAD
jgi:SAM-dependent methyltransferase